MFGERFQLNEQTIPIIALTANAFGEDVQRNMQAGLNAHLSKPVEPEMLFKTLESLLAGKPPRQEAGSAGAHAEGKAQAPDGQPAPEAGEERRQS